MPDAPLTPEEKLLRIIESPPEVLRRMQPRASSAGAGFSLVSFKLRYLPRLKSYCTLKSANALVVFVAFGLTVFLGLDFWMGLPRLSVIKRLEGEARNFDPGDLSIGRLNPVSVYLDEIVGRNIFALPEAPPKLPEAGAGGNAIAPAADIALFADGLKLVGIIWSEAPQAIIEDTKDGRTHLLNRAGKIKNLRVKEILKDRVVLSYDNQEIELR